MAVASPQLGLGTLLAKREREERLAASSKAIKMETIQEPEPETPLIFEDCQY